MVRTVGVTVAAPGGRIGRVGVRETLSTQRGQRESRHAEPPTVSEDREAREARREGVWVADR